MIGTQWGCTYSSDGMFGSRFVAPERGTAYNIMVALRRSTNNVPGPVNVKCLIYRADNLVLVGVTEIIACDLVTTGFLWFGPFNFATPPVLEAGVEYWLLAEVDIPSDGTNSDNIRIAYDSDAAMDMTGSYPLDFSLSPPDPLPGINYVNDGTTGRLCSIYCNYISEVPTALSVAVSPSSATLQIGESQNFNAEISGGVGPYTVRWIDNATQNELGTELSFVFQATAEGNYEIYVEVTDAEETVANSSIVPITVTSLPPTTHTLSINSTPIQGVPFTIKKV